MSNNNLYRWDLIRRTLLLCVKLSWIYFSLHLSNKCRNNNVCLMPYLVATHCNRISIQFIRNRKVCFFPSVSFWWIWLLSFSNDIYTIWVKCCWYLLPESFAIKYFPCKEISKYKNSKIKRIGRILVGK